jgi:hypothetical protein
MLRDQAPVPPQECRWRHDEGRPPDARQSSTRRGQEHSIGIPKRRSANLSAQYAELVPQDHDLQFLELGRSEQQSEQL